VLDLGYEPNDIVQVFNDKTGKVHYGKLQYIDMTEKGIEVPIYQIRLPKDIIRVQRSKIIDRCTDERIINWFDNMEFCYYSDEIDGEIIYTYYYKNKGLLEKVVKQYRNDIVKFTEDYYGLKLYWYQKLLLKSIYKNNIK
jgi:hypothetical protein